MQESMSFNFHWSQEVIIITLTISVLAFVLCAPILTRKHTLAARIISGISFICVLSVYLFLPLHIELSANAFSARMLSHSIHIYYREVAETYTIEKNALQNSVRVFGSGGMCGYLGKYKNETIGRYTMYATDLSQLFLIRKKDGNIYIFSSPNRDKIVSTIQNRKYDIQR